jgi:hypothetical protein
MSVHAVSECFESIASQSADLAALLAESSPASQRKPWSTPRIGKMSSKKTKGDPTISDDGLGDGLFS